MPVLGGVWKNWRRSWIAGSKWEISFPIFYHVDPYSEELDTGNHKGAFFYDDRNGDEEGRRKIERWREALKTVANVMGWSETRVIEEITSTIWKCSNRELLHVEKNLVGMDCGRASSSSTSIGPWDYEVFLSFRVKILATVSRIISMQLCIRTEFVPLDWMITREKRLNHVLLKLLRRQDASS
ncbi:hypothetical protein CK203_094063 [Vitis vinifera]|uniref:TIR domain-containing protein n=1 Tax=Vitis vinifera TaxID=29760 RepID=A0A438E144_VITVI|nr:hypothetical protein CK203_094063 [Vitis vinifera]